MSATAAKETLGFQTEVKELLHLMVHSLYSNKEIFLRELVSNASDACDKLRFEALSAPALLEDDNELRIRIEYDAAARTLTITDNGIGMLRQEVIDNIGTIARSGTREFFSKLSGDQAKDANLIGQFGVGFYSAFIVAERVTLTTRRAGAAPADGVRWASEGAGDYTIEPVERAARGTEIVLHLREGEDDLLNGHRLRTIVQKYSDHIQLPIEMRKESWDEAKKAEVVTDEWETVNQANALWARPKAEITAEQYDEFYKHVGHDYEKPLAHVHARVEGTKEYTVLLYIPSHPPFDLWDAHARRGVKLYVRRVFIMDDAEHLMPQYLRFVRGVIDSSDLPLNVSREILQESRDVQAIRSGATKRVLGLLEELAADQADKYAEFWKEFGRVMKEGIGEDHANRERIAKLLRFASTHADTDAQTVSLADYVSRMKPGQDKIYTVTADSFGAAKASPHLEIFRKKGIEVLLLSDRVDEWLLAHLPEFDGKALQSVAKGALELDTLADAEEKKAIERDEGEFKDVLSRVKASLGEKVKDVRITHRLTESASCLVADEHDPGGNLQRLLKAAGQKVPEAAPILELNPAHPLVARLKAETADERFTDLAAVLFDEAVLAEGGQLEDAAGFVRRLNKLLG